MMQEGPQDEPTWAVPPLIQAFESDRCPLCTLVGSTFAPLVASHPAAADSRCYLASTTPISRASRHSTAPPTCRLTSVRQHYRQPLFTLPCSLLSIRDFLSPSQLAPSAALGDRTLGTTPGISIRHIHSTTVCIQGICREITPIKRQSRHISGVGRIPLPALVQEKRSPAPYVKRQAILGKAHGFQQVPATPPIGFVPNPVSLIV